MTSWEELIKSVRADVKGTKTKLRLGAASGEWKAMVADEAARVAFCQKTKRRYWKRISSMASIWILNGRRLKKSMKITVWLF